MMGREIIDDIIKTTLLDKEQIRGNCINADESATDVEVIEVSIASDSPAEPARKTPLIRAAKPAYLFAAAAVLVTLGGFGAVWMLKGGVGDVGDVDGIVPGGDVITAATAYGEPEPEAGISDKSKIGDIIRFGGIDWRVLDAQGEKALLIAEKIIEYRAYHTEDTDITWNNCHLRDYLNGDFYDNAFTKEEKEKIAETTVINKDNPWYGTHGGSDTNDKVFLLSLEEIVQYFGDSGQLNNRPGDIDFISDEYNAARLAYDVTGEAGWWWFRAPGGSGNSTVSVNKDGSVDLDGSFVNSLGGIRPALWLNLSSSSNDGTPPSNAQDEITAEKAMNIALEHVGGGTVTECEPDSEDGRKVYEIEIVFNGIKHEMEVDAATGEITEYSWEPYDNDD